MLKRLLRRRTREFLDTIRRPNPRTWLQVSKGDGIGVPIVRPLALRRADHTYPASEGSKVIRGMDCKILKQRYIVFFGFVAIDQTKQGRQRKPLYSGQIKYRGILTPPPSFPIPTFHPNF